MRCTIQCCQALINAFKIGSCCVGENEWKRCNELQNRIIIVWDQISPCTEQLSGKSMSHINKCVFETGDSMRIIIITLTATASFVRKAEKRDIKYFVYIHPVRECETIDGATLQRINGSMICQK
eukprot:749331_1